MNEQYRVTFRWENAHAHEVRVEDYHYGSELAGAGDPTGEILLEEYLKPLGVAQVAAAKRLGISRNRLNEIVLGKRGITADIALRLAEFLKTSPQLWMWLQADWDLYDAMQKEARRAS